MRSQTVHVGLPSKHHIGWNDVKLPRFVVLVFVHVHAPLNINSLAKEYKWRFERSAAMTLPQADEKAMRKEGQGTVERRLQPQQKLVIQRKNVQRLNSRRSSFSKHGKELEYFFF